MFYIMCHQANTNENKITMKCHNIHIGMVKTYNMTTLNASKDVEQKELSLIVSENAKWDTYFGR